MTDSKPPGNGGNVIFTVGAPGVAEETAETIERLGGPIRTGVPKAEPGNFIFELADGSEVLRISGTGVVTVRGEIVENNIAVYRAFLSWLRSTAIILGRGEADGEDATFEAPK